MSNHTKPLLRAQAPKGPRGFESHPLRHFPSKSGIFRDFAPASPALILAVSCASMRNEARMYGRLRTWPVQNVPKMFVEN